MIAVNAWVNNPTGFTIADGPDDVIVGHVNPWRAMFNDGVWLQFLHMWVGAFMVVGLVVSGVYAAGSCAGVPILITGWGSPIPFVFAMLL